MAYINQIFYFILTIFISSMFFNAFLELKELKKGHRSDIYWVLALSALMTSNFSFSITPITTYFFLTVANSLNFAATICLALLFRSWNTVVTKRLDITAFLLLLVFGLVFEYSRVEENYLARTYIVIGGLMSIGTWQLTEIWLIKLSCKLWFDFKITKSYLCFNNWIIYKLPKQFQCLSN